MSLLDLTTLLISLAAVFSIINLRLLKLPQTIGLMTLAIALSMAVLVGGLISPKFLAFVTILTQQFDFSDLLVNIMLPFLLFAGAISVDVHKLLKDKLTILLLAGVGILFSTFAVGSGLY
ncbi:cation:proton antiporter, partial [Flavobacteriaceae bacterium]|nr:cation:proton antiporter [Flavobacteriaceae bacterium]